MAYNVSNITEYVNSKGELISKAVLGSDTIEKGGITIMSGVKYKERLTYMDNQIWLQAESCGWTSGGSGSTTLTEKDITVVALKEQKELCPSDLRKYTLNLKLNGGYEKSIPEEGLWVENYIKNIALTNEYMIWANSAASTTRPAGWLYQIGTTDSGNTYQVSSVGIATSGSTKSATTWISDLKTIYNTLPTKYRGNSKLTLFVGKEVFSYLSAAFVTANNVHVAGTDFTNFNFNAQLIGFPFMIKGVEGLTGTNKAVLTPSDNLIVAVDLESEDERVNVRWDDSNEIVKASVHYKIGTSYYFSDAIVLVS